MNKHKKQLEQDLLNAVDKYRIDSHVTRKHGAKLAIRILQKMIDEKPELSPLLTDSEFLGTLKRGNPRKRGMGWRWWPAVSWFKRVKV